MRHLLNLAAASCLAVLSGHAAQARDDATKIPVKWFKIINNSEKTLYPIIFEGAKDRDEWLQSYFQTGPKKINTEVYASSHTYRSYVIEDQGMAPGTSIYVQVPYFSQLVTNPDGTKDNQYVTWWNGGRILFYDDKAQVLADYNSTDQKLVTPVTAGLSWCRDLNAGKTACKAPRSLNLFSAKVGLPATDLSQLMEYTFADAVTANGAPYPLYLNKVGYNISSVDQVYLPVAMEPLGNPTIPYIGTTVPLKIFRDRLDNFLRDYPGWPIYNPVIEGAPRIPGAYNVFAVPQDLTARGATIDAMESLYRKCNTAMPPEGTLVCTQYREVVALVQANYDEFVKLPCHDTRIVLDEKEIIKKVYGWVPFNEGCGAGANALVNTFSKKKFDQLLATYIQLQYSMAAPRFNPYVSLIHDPNYLNMAAYAFSVDDAVGFQSYIGTGLIIAYAGDAGLDNKTPLDLADRVTVTLGDTGRKPRFTAYGLCANAANYGQFLRGFPSVDFFPTKYPCMFTATDTAKKTYQFLIKTGPKSPGGLSVSCPADVSNPAWCSGAAVVGPQQINGRQPD